MDLFRQSKAISDNSWQNLENMNRSLLQILIMVLRDANASKRKGKTLWQIASPDDNVMEKNLWQIASPGWVFFHNNGSRKVQSLPIIPDLLACHINVIYYKIFWRGVYIITISLYIYIYLLLYIYIYLEIYIFIIMTITLYI